MTELEPQSFGQLRLRGGRYEARGFPVEVLPELSRYGQLVQDVARGLWKDQNPGRKRIPKGFSNEFGLRLVEVRGGSVTPILERRSDDLFDLGLDDLFGQAAELIVQTVAAVQEGGRVPSELPSTAHSSFIQFGKSLRDDERIELGWDGAPTATYTPEVRRGLISYWSVERFSADGSVVGQVIGVHPENQTFSFATLRGESISGRYTDPGVFDDLQGVMQAKALAPIVRLDGELEWTNADSLLGVLDVRSVELFIADDEPGADRFIDLLRIERGWLDGEGKRVELGSIEAARRIIRLIDRPAESRPGIFPMPDGGVQLEWHAGWAIASVEVSPDLSFSCYFLALKLNTEQELVTDDVRAAAAFIATTLSGQNV